MKPKILSIVSGYSSRANTRYGYHDYEMFVEFEDGTEEDQLEEMKVMRENLRKTNMWAYSPKKVDKNKWKICYGFDSGD